jgi:hypothetical protein
MTNGDDRREVKDNEALYSNYFKIGYNAFEFVLDFGQFYMDSERESLHTRIVTAPPYAKALIEVLQKSVAAYEQKFGVIPPRAEGSETC